MTTIGMKQPIGIDQIKAGDLIRAEHLHEAGRAFEYRARNDDGLYASSRYRYYLLDRPKPTVVLPTVPTLGWATVPTLGWATNFGDRLIHTVGKGRGGTDVPNGGYVDSCAITAFTPATAVPTAALDELRTLFGKSFDDPSDLVRDFLKAVAAANGADR